MAAIATRMGERKISLESIMQKGGVASRRRRRSDPPVPHEDHETVRVVLITHATSETAIREALDLALADGVVTQKPQVIRIERE
jgi:homoserine dehydrogenase